jgi:hypothetical protein
MFMSYYLLMNKQHGQQRFKENNEPYRSREAPKFSTTIEVEKPKGLEEMMMT